MDDRHRTDPAVDLATAAIIRAERNMWEIQSEYLGALREAFGMLSSHERERCRALLVDLLAQRNAMPLEDARRIVRDWFPDEKER